MNTTAHRTPAIAAICLCLGFLGGCAAGIPTYPRADAAAVLDTLRERQGSIHSIQAGSSITFANDADRLQLDGALVAELPDKLRLKGWKLGRAVFDATYVEGRLWTVAPESHPIHPDQARGLRRGFELALAVLGSRFYEDATPGATSGDVLSLSGRVAGVAVRCEVDVPTRTARRFIVLDDAGSDAGRVELADYFRLGEVVLPRRIVIVSPSGSIQVRMHDVELNQPLSDLAFKPPSRAAEAP